MDLIWFILPLCVGFVKAQNLTEVKVGLGQNATLICPSNKTDIHWFMQIHNQIRVAIARTVNEETSLHYLNTSKYRSIGDKLVLTNISTEDFRLYFCARKKNNSFKDEKTFLLASDVAVTPSTNQSESAPSTNQSESVPLQPYDVMVYSSFAVNALLLVVVIGLSFTSLRLKRKLMKQSGAPSCEDAETLGTAQYEEIHVPPSRRPPSQPPRPNTPSAPLDCVYYKAQLPRPTSPPR